MLKELKKEPIETMRSVWSKIPIQVRTAFLTALVVGLITHFYTFTNLFPNHDGINSALIFDQDMLFQGRWFQRIAMFFSSPYNMPWVNGCLSILILSMAVGFTVSVVGVKKKVSAILIACFMVTFPTIASSYTYLYMADGFMVALLFAAFAVYLSRKFKKFGFLFASIFICLSLAIYQAYICYSIALFVVLLVFDVLDDRKLGKEIILQAIKDLGSLVLGLVLYAIVLLILLKVKDETLVSYQNINQMGVSSVANLISSTILAFKSFFKYFMEDTNKFFTIPTVIMHFCAVGVSAILGIYIFVKKKIWKNSIKTILLVMLFILIPVALNSIYLLSAQVVHSLMIYSMSVFFILFLKLVEIYKECTNKENCKILLSWFALIISVVIIFDSFLLSNKAYYTLQTNYNKTYAYAIKVSTRVEDSPGYYEGIPVAFIGYTKNAPITTFPLIGVGYRSTYITEHSSHYYNFFRDYVGVDYTRVSFDQLQQIRETQMFKDMPVYPLQGCTAIIDEVFVIKLGTYENFHS